MKRFTFLIDDTSYWSEPCVFGSLEPDPLEKKNQELEPEPLGIKKSGAGARAAKTLSVS